LLCGAASRSFTTKSSEILSQNDEQYSCIAYLDMADSPAEKRAPMHPDRSVADPVHFRGRMNRIDRQK
jgi:hypothetical protein